MYLGISLFHFSILFIYMESNKIDNDTKSDSKMCFLNIILLLTTLVVDTYFTSVYSFDTNPALISM